MADKIARDVAIHSQQPLTLFEAAVAEFANI